MKRKASAQKQDTRGVHVWLVFMKAFQSIMPHAAESIARTELGDSDFRILEALLHKGPLPGEYRRPESLAHAGVYQRGCRSAGEKGLVARKDHPDDRRVRRVELTPKGRALITPAVFASTPPRWKKLRASFQKTNA